jgi:histidinol-phosphate aminotransferase
MENDRYWGDIVSELRPYVPGEQPKNTNLIKLNTNENPYPPSPKVREAVIIELDGQLRLYPDPNADRLKKEISSTFNVEAEKIFVGNGSDEVLAHIFHAFFKQKKPIFFPDVTYSFYEVYCGLYRVPYQLVPLEDDLSINFDDYKRPNGGIIFPNPNAPTGRLLTLAAVENLLKDNQDSVVVVDEAYIDFGGESAVPLTSKYSNLLVTQSLSKSRSLAGLRVGFAIGNSSLISALNRIKNSFNSYPLDRLAIAGSVAALNDRNYFEGVCQKVINSRDELALSLASLGFSVTPSAANFLFVTHSKHNAVGLLSALRVKGILVRHFDKPKISEYLRISVGLPEQNTYLLKALKEIIEGQAC